MTEHKGPQVNPTTSGFLLNNNNKPEPYDDFFAEKRSGRNVACLIFVLLQSTNKKARYVSTSCRMKTLWLKSS